MRIVIDVRPLQKDPAVRGIGTYVRELLRHLSRVDTTNDYFLMQCRGVDPLCIDLSEGFKVHTLWVGAWRGRLSAFNLLRDWLFLGREVGAVRPDVVHFTAPIEARQFYDVGRYNGSTVATLHDITPIVCRSLVFRGRRALLWPLYRFLFHHLRSLGHVITNSATTARDAEQVIGIPASRVTATPLALPEDPDVARASADELLHAVPAAAEDYLLYVGELSPSKNPALLAPLVAGLERLHGRKLHLIVVGRPSASSRAVAEEARRLGVADRVHFTGYVSIALKRALLTSAHCRCMVFPSLYEGFGLPALEAMAYGVPLVASNAGALPEVVADGGVTVDPRDVDAWVRAVESILADDAQSRTLRERALIRAQAFTWERTARATLAVYERIAATEPSA